MKVPVSIFDFVLIIFKKNAGFELYGFDSSVIAFFKPFLGIYGSSLSTKSCDYDYLRRIEIRDLLWAVFQSYERPEEVVSSHIR